MLVFSFKSQILKLSSISNMNLAILMAINDVKNSPVITDLQIQACKSFIALDTGCLELVGLGGSEMVGAIFRCVYFIRFPQILIIFHQDTLWE